MSTQWHPLFAHLLGLLIEDYYDVRTDVPVSDLPREGDLLLVRRQGGPAPPFVGLWSHLTDWNVLEFKGPTDGPEEDDLELLLHVGTGITYRHNEGRRQDDVQRLANRQVSLWYLAPRLGEAFLGYARGRAHLSYETGGLWRGQVWGHPLWLLAYQDAPVEEDTVPLRLLDLEPPAPRALGELLLQRQELMRRFATWLVSLQPGLWEEIRQMSSTKSGLIDWERVSKVEDLSAVVNFLPLERVIQVVGVERAIEAIGLGRVVEVAGLPRVIEAVGLPRVIEAVGLPRVIEAVGLPRVIEAVGLTRVIEAVGLTRVIEAIGAEKLLGELLEHVPAEQVQEALRRRQQQGSPPRTDQGPE